MKTIQQIRIGVLGGGQLGKMLYAPAMKLDLDIAFLDSDSASPCARFASQFIQGSLQDYEQVLRFGLTKDLITIEIENVHVNALFELESRGISVFPQPQVIQLIQDKRTQKQFYINNGFPTAEFILVDTKEEIRKHEAFFPAFHKMGRDGYDGKGVRRIQSLDDIEATFDQAGLLEKEVPNVRELSVIVARTLKGEIKSYPIVESVFDPVYHLVDYLIAPAQVSPTIASRGKELAESLAESLGIVGLLAVEMFLTTDEQLLINEVAPRTHNSGHHTIEAAYTSQFEQQLRAILGLSLGDTKALSHAAMVNLVGEVGYIGSPVYSGLDELMKIPGVFMHLYGKKETRPGRKMGHVTVVDNDTENLIRKVKFIKDNIRVIA